jgi:hypothetical protein
MKKLLPLTFLLGALAPIANAQYAALGLPDPVNHFPSWVSDSNGVSLSMCLDNSGFCLLTPPDPTSPFSVTTGFGMEVFYNNATAKVGNGGNTPLLVLALEGTYFTSTPTDGQQNVFGRVRVRVPGLAPGNYLVTHPWLPTCTPKVYNVPAGSQGINATDDLGGGTPFTGLLAATNDIGPHIKWDPAVAPLAPVGYLGNPGVTHTVVGGVCAANNTFKVTGPVPAGGGTGPLVLNQPLFAVSGKIFVQGPPALVIDRATYDHTGATTRVNVFSSSAPTASLSLSSVLGEAAGNMTSDLAGNFYRQVSGAAVAPASVTVTATVPGVAGSTVRTLPLTDEIVVDPAVYNVAGKSLVVTAHSSEKVTPPVLTATVGAQQIVMTSLGAGNYTATALNVVTPPVSVTVKSSRGGVDSELIAD